ncbi:hypothetical protein [Agromyces kandeliae]|uniref:Uncharacterized protein n=1 Tax=Agromyces kandeliae TaxID=2666141 RepID=A0A6L5QX21_9MICO|nr:hypothetical protein [Agromyces kandeliae]MRX42336.1 hypothetical protein [Agromyces kandeliae]
MIADVDRAPAASVAHRIGGVARRALRLELRISASIGRLIARRPAIGPGATGFGYLAACTSTPSDAAMMVELPSTETLRASGCGAAW